jgi:hypothetical protein
VVLLAVVSGGCGQDLALVGATCAAGYTACADRCVNLSSDPDHCGLCNHACPSGAACVFFLCSPWTDAASAPAGGSDSGGTGDASATAGDSDSATSQGDSSGGGSPPSCADGLSACGAACVDLTSDPNNCGQCGSVCPSQICVGSGCAGTTRGGIVFIGHDYASTAAGTAQARVLSNAVLLPQRPSIHVLSYERYADPNAVARVRAILTGAASGGGRTVTISSTVTDADVAALSFADYSVLLLPDQPKADDVDLGALGALWAPALAAFSQAGGVVIVLDGGTGAGQMPALVTGTELLNVSAQTPVATGSFLDVVAPADAIGVGVLSPYGAGSNTVTVTTEGEGPSAVVVVTTQNDSGSAANPVVVHKVF